MSESSSTNSACCVCEQAKPVYWNYANQGFCGPCANGIPKGEAPAPSRIREALDELTLTLALKNSDYKIAGEFSNFYYAHDVAGVGIRDVFLIHIATKLGRIRGLLQSDRDVNYEAIEDSIKDLAGYAVLMYAHELSMKG